MAVKLLDALDKINHKTVFLLLEFLATFYHVFLSNLWKNTAVNGTSRFKSTAPDKCINFFKKMQNSSRVYFSHNLLEIWWTLSHFSPLTLLKHPNDLTFSRNLHCVELYKIFKIVDHLIIFTASVQTRNVFLVVCDPLKGAFK